MRISTGRVLFHLAGSVLAVLLAWQAWSLHVTPTDLPSGDAGYYAAQALDLRALLLEGAWGPLLQRLTWPELHPPLHPLLLALWSSTLGVTQQALRSYGAAVTLISLVVALPLLGRRIAPAGGAQVGLLTALVLLLGPTLPTHLFTCMTEPTSLLTWVLVLGLALNGWQAPRPGAQLLVGAALLAAGLARFTNLPLLLAPLLLADLLTRGAPPWRARLLRWACWLAPSLLVGGAWWLVEPALPRAIAAFTVTGQPTPSGTAAAWLWAPWAIATRSVGNWPVALGLMGLFVLGLVPMLTRREHHHNLILGPMRLDLRLGRPPGLALLQLGVLVGLAALTVHPYKVTRNLSTLAPLLILASLLPWLDSRLRWRGRPATDWGSLAAAGVLLVAQWGLQPSQSPDGDKPASTLSRITNDYPDHLPQPEATALLEALVPRARAGPWLLVRGWGYPDSLLHVWAADLDLDAELITGWDPAGLTVEPGGAHTAVVVLVSPPFPPKKRSRRDDQRQTAATLEAKGCHLLPPARTEWGWRLEVLHCTVDSVDSARQPVTRDDIVQRELKLR